MFSIIFPFLNPNNTLIHFPMNDTLTDCLIDLFYFIYGYRKDKKDPKDNM